ncbi:MAG: NAD(P)/FAD-dependent oxidoreductase [Faecalibacterium sp.]|nr:NAD(P)/FAD-dependent oxidoreductase [Ruminococcus sp.]MCM1392167.1 NAD(P)/FAD-dependent oxidoreductase [Ruminococcus sp.]MCM1486029.1 NAD(P)/FAD-dependent oxidoreductase [Faecalibacterium sp.]
MFDTAIIGAGPAGISAALNLKLHNKNFIWFGSKSFSIKVEKSEKIANYPGISMVSGSELNKSFLQQIDEMGIELTDEMVTNISSTRNGYMILGGNKIYDAKTIILATGGVTAKGLPGESELLGHGVSYCATCDGFLYKGKTIAVFCAAKRHEHEIAYLAGIADKVYLFTSYNDCEIDLPNVTKVSSPIIKINGEERVESITLKDGGEFQLNGVFILRSTVAPATLLKGLEMDGPHIAVNRRCETNKSGCYAAGDCTGRPYQIAKAVGEGNIAAHSVLEYLAALEDK